MLESGVLLDLYAAAECETRWTPMLDGLCDALSVRSAVVQVVQEATTQGWETWTVRDTHSTAEAARHDTFLNRPDSPRFRVHPNSRSQTEISSDQRNFAGADDLMDDMQRRVSDAGLGIGLWASFPIACDRTFSLILHRHPDDMRDLDEAEDRYLRALLPHLQQAVQLSARISRLQSRADTLAQMSGQIQTGLVLCSADLSYDWCNAAAVEVLTRADLLVLAAGRVRCTRPADADRLRGAVRAVAEGSTKVARLVLIDDNGMPLHIRVAPAGQVMTGTAMLGDAPPIALMISLPEARTDFDVEDVAALFNLSPAEARLASALAGGASITEYAQGRGISTGTARVQLNRVLSKTGAQRQAELVRVLHGSSAARVVSAGELF